jgi:hypothetical protein
VLNFEYEQDPRTPQPGQRLTPGDGFRGFHEWPQDRHDAR